jgi:hypothetical protein
MPTTNNLNNKYTVSVVTDSTGGDNNPTASGYNTEYEMIITPKPGEDIVGGDFKIDNIGSVIADSSVGYPNSTPVSTPHGNGSSYSHLDLRTSTTTFASFTSYVFEANPSFQSKNIDYIILTEKYGVADFPIAFKLKIFMLSSFLNAGPSSVQIDLDIDLVSQVIPGCTNPNAINYNPVANLDDGSCRLPIFGCMDDGTNPSFPGRPSNAIPGPANNYDPLVTQQSSCLYTLFGCTDSNADNYDPDASVDDGSCTYTVTGCTNPLATNYNPLANTDDGSCIVPKRGCTDANALNYDQDAFQDDGSCILPCSDVTMKLSSTVTNYYSEIFCTVNIKIFSNTSSAPGPAGRYTAYALQLQGIGKVNGATQHYVTYIEHPRWITSQAGITGQPPDYFTAEAQNPNFAPNYYNSLKIEFLPASTQTNPNPTRITLKDFATNYQEDYFFLTPGSRASHQSGTWASSPFYLVKKVEKPFIQFDYNDGNGIVPIQPGVYFFTFVIDDGFGNLCFLEDNLEIQSATGARPILPPDVPIEDDDSLNINGDIDPDLTDDSLVGLPVGLPPAPEGFHYMPDGSLMSDADHQDLFGSSDTVIRRSASSDTSSSEPGTSSTSGY